MRLMAVIFLTFMSVACRHEQPTNTPVQGEPEFQLPDKPFVPNGAPPSTLQPKSMAVISGPAPLAFIHTSGGAIYVVDETSDITIASGAVAAKTLIRVDEAHGVIFGNETISPGPLPAGHRFGVYLKPPEYHAYPKTATQPNAP